MITKQTSSGVSVISLFAAQFFGIENQVLERLTQDQSLYDSKAHKLRDGITKDRARAVLLLAAHIAIGCGFKLLLSAEEQELMGKKFETRRSN
jgi:hypothetical protein